MYQSELPSKWSCFFGGARPVSFVTDKNSRKRFFLLNTLDCNSPPVWKAAACPVRSWPLQEAASRPCCHLQFPAAAAAEFPATSRKNSPAPQEAMSHKSISQLTHKTNRNNWHLLTQTQNQGSQKMFSLEHSLLFARWEKTDPVSCNYYLMSLWVSAWDVMWKMLDTSERWKKHEKQGNATLHERLALPSGIWGNGFQVKFCGPRVCLTFQILMKLLNQISCVWISALDDDKLGRDQWERGLWSPH